jgi:ABC-2 type transport system ATP-binding protein/lipopolysaccharide transport system ATP-binding protein
MTANAIEAVALSKRFTVPTERRTSFKERVVRGRSPKPREFWALKDATFSVPKGSSLGLIGQNGSGKSTALKVLTGIYRPTSGHVTVNGSVSALLEVGAGFHPELTGRENIRLNATILGFTNREIDRLMGSIIEFADIGEHIDAPIKHYSSGMYVRLGFAVAVMVRPEILLVDEVIAVGDEEFQRKCYDFLYDLRRAGTSMIVVSHGLSQIVDLCDEAVWLEHGTVAGRGPAARVVHDYLASVNLREASRSAGSSEPPGGGQVLGRRGSGDVRIDSARFLDRSGSAVDMLLVGHPCRLQMRYHARRAANLEVELEFLDESAVVVTGATTNDLPSLSTPTGEGFIVFAMDPLLLAEGSYRVHIRILADGKLADALDEGIPLTVRAAGIQMPGYYVQPGAWRFGKDSLDVSEAALES